MRLLHAARLSKKARGHEQTGIESSDLEAQRWAAEHGHQIVATVADTKSGTSHMWARPNLRPWVTEPEKLALYDGVVAYKSDRLSRARWADEVQIRLWAEEHGKALFIVSPALHWPPANMAEQISWDMFAAQAHEEWKNTSERYRRMVRYLNSEGKLQGRPPFGYQVVPAEGGHKTLAPTDLGRKYIPAIFNRILDGDSLDTVGRWLESEGVQPPNSKRWWHGSLAVIIRNPVYAGRRVDASGRTILRCEALVSASTYRRANEALSSHPKRGPFKSGNRSMLSSALFCSRCNSPMYRIHTRNGTFYRCAGRGAARKGCGNMVPLKLVDDAVNELAGRTFTRPVMVRKTVSGPDPAAELEEVRFEIQQLPMRDLSDSEHDAELARLRAERDRLAALEPSPVREELVPTGQTYAELWATLEPSEKGPWLTAHGFRVKADKRSVRLVTPTWLPWEEQVTDLLPPRDLLPNRGRAEPTFTFTFRGVKRDQ